jgi:uncharacterized glyoxalase superfamily protein PhnB
MDNIASQPTPAGWPRISPSLVYERAAAAIDWLCTAFGFEVRLKVVGDAGRIEHSELVLGDGLVMIGDVDANRSWRKSPGQLAGANTQTLCIYVDDVDAHCARARAAGARIQTEAKTTDYGDDYWTDRSYEAVDPEGHHWWFMQRIK